MDAYCAADDDERESWCLDRDRYVALPAFGQAPSHPLMYQPNTVDDSTRELIVSALLALDDTEDGQSILENILNTPGLIETNAEDHLGSYGGLIQHVPGIQGYLDEKYSSA